jgi:hypothetical protein
MSLLSRLFGGGGESDAFNLPNGIDPNVGLVAGPDSTRLAYVVRGRNRMHVEVNGKRLGTYDEVSGVTFSTTVAH